MILVDDSQLLACPYIKNINRDGNKILFFISDLNKIVSLPSRQFNDTNTSKKLFYDSKKNILLKCV